MKVGIIQNAPRTADFSHNLRHIVQGYRACIDHGANLVVASAHALCGPGVYDLVTRDSFQQQMKLALQTLSRELGETPLILGAYTSVPEDAEWEETDSGAVFRPKLTPYFLENDVVEELENGENFEWEEMHLYITTDDTPLPPQWQDYDMIIHCAASPWYADILQEEEYNRRQEAINNNAVVVSAACIGTAEQQVFGGGSGVYTPNGKTLMRLPWFDTSNHTASVTPPWREIAQEHLTPAATLIRMLLQGIRDSVRQYGYGGACIPLDFPHSDLLAILAAEALGRNNVEGLTFSEGESLAGAIGIPCHKLDTSGMLQQAEKQLGNEQITTLKARLQAVLLSEYCESRGMMLLCPLSRRNIMLGDFTLYGESCGHLAPLGNLYEMDLHILRKEFSEKYASLFGALAEPSDLQTDIIIHALADCNISAGRFIRENNFNLGEQEIRKIQRRLITAAAKRKQLPPVLLVSPPNEQIIIPSSHRLND